MSIRPESYRSGVWSIVFDRLQTCCPRLGHSPAAWRRGRLSRLRLRSGSYRRLGTTAWLRPMPWARGRPGRPSPLGTPRPDSLHCWRRDPGRRPSKDVSIQAGKSFAGRGDHSESVMILDLSLLFGIKSKIMTEGVAYSAHASLAGP